MTWPLPALCNASAMGRFRRHKDCSWAHLPVPSCCSSSTHSHKQVTACSQVTWAPIREQVICPGLMVSARPCILWTQTVWYRSSTDSGVKAAPVQQGTAMLWSQPGQNLSKVNEKCVQISWKIHICQRLIGFYLSSAERSISIFLLMYLCHSEYDGIKWNIWKSEAKDDPVINSYLVCTSPGKKHCNIILVSLLLAQSLFLSLLIFTNLISQRNSSQIKKKRESLGRVLEMLLWFVRKEKHFFVPQGQSSQRLKGKRQEKLTIALFSAVYVRH